MPDPIGSNKRRTACLLVLFVVVTSAIGAIVGLLAGNTVVGVLVGLGAALLVTVSAYWKSDRIALSVSRAIAADPDEYRRLHNVVEGLCIANGLPKPGVYVVHDPAPNAFAVGRGPKHASVAVTTGLLDALNRVELEGVIAHELSHVRNYDVLLNTMAVTLVGSVTLLAEIGVRSMWWNGGRVMRAGDRGRGTNPLGFVGLAVLVVAPLFGRLMRFVVRHRRESLADLSACQMTRYPPGLVSALEKLRSNTTVTHSSTGATAHLWLAQPMSGVGDAGRLAWAHRSFDTHPPLEERIAVLLEL